MNQAARSPLVPRDRLDALALAAQRAHQAHVEARMVRDRAKQGQSTLWRMLLRLVGKDAEHNAVGRAEQASKAADLAAQQEARRWVVAYASIELLQHSEYAQRHAKLRTRLKQLRSRAANIRTLLQYSQSAVSSLRHAAQECRSASHMEVADAFTKSKGIAIASTLSTSCAADAIATAQRATHAYLEILPKRGDKLDMAHPSDLLDLAFDLTLAPGIDILSLINASSLEASAVRCEDLAEKISQSQVAIDRAMRKADSAIGLLSLDLKTIEQPFINAAYGLLPLGVSIKPPESLE